MAFATSDVETALMLQDLRFRRNENGNVVLGFDDHTIVILTSDLNKSSLRAHGIWAHRRDQSTFGDTVVTCNEYNRKMWGASMYLEVLEQEQPVRGVIYTDAEIRLTDSQNIQDLRGHVEAIINRLLHSFEWLNDQYGVA